MKRYEKPVITVDAGLAITGVSITDQSVLLSFDPGVRLQEANWIADISYESMDDKKNPRRLCSVGILLFSYQ